VDLLLVELDHLLLNLLRQCVFLDYLEVGLFKNMSMAATLVLRDGLDQHTNIESLKLCQVALTACSSDSVMSSSAASSMAVCSLSFRTYIFAIMLAMLSTCFSTLLALSQ
jgi:hypothetical protein